MNEMICPFCAKRERNEQLTRSVLKDRKTLKEVGDSYGITAPRVRQIVFSWCIRTNRKAYNDCIVCGRLGVRGPSLSNLRNNWRRFVA